MNYSELNLAIQFNLIAQDIVLNKFNGAKKGRRNRLCKSQTSLGHTGKACNSFVG